MTTTKDLFESAADRIARKQHELAEEIRAYSQSFKEYWKRAPWLALQADGRSGYLSAYDFACSTGYWMVPLSGGPGTVYVDCATGELMSGFREQKPAADHLILRFANCLNELNGKEIVASLEEHVSKDYSSYLDKPVEEIEAWRQRKIEKYNLKKVFTRS